MCEFTTAIFPSERYSSFLRRKRKTKTNDVTPAEAGVQSEKAGFPLEFIPHFDAGRE
jgi:hypothetical protein